MTTPVTRLNRSLTLGPVVLFGLAYMAPMIVLGTFGELADSSGDAVPTAYLLALVAMLFTAISYGRMAAAFPVAGSAYTYTRRTVDSRVGFLVGWAVLLDYFFLPMVIWLIGASFLARQFPGVPSWVWIVAFIVLTTSLNVVGIRLAANVNLLAIRRRRLTGVRNVLVNVVLPLVGAAVDVWLLTNLEPTAKILGLSWLGVGVLYLAYLTRGFRRPPPELDFAEESADDTAPEPAL